MLTPSARLRMSDLFQTRVRCIPEFGAENKSAIFQDLLLLAAFLSVRGRFQNPRQTPVRTKLRLKRFPVMAAKIRCSRVKNDRSQGAPILAQSLQSTSGAAPRQYFLPLGTCKGLLREGHGGEEKKMRNLEALRATLV